jgi:hypothetical protein
VRFVEVGFRRVDAAICESDSSNTLLLPPATLAIRLLHVAATDARFVLGSAAPHPHELVLGNYSVHTSDRALRDGETEIRRIGATLRERGKDSYALRQY